MLVKRKRGWELRESEATPEAVFHDRRRVVQAMGFGALIAAAGGGDLAIGEAMAAVEADPSAGLYPAKRNPRYTLDRPITDEKLATTYNNFYEFGSQKTIAEDAQALPIRPWTVTIDGMVAKPLTLGIDELLKRVTLEERLSFEGADRSRGAAGLGEIPAHGDLPQRQSRLGPEAVLVPLALCRRTHHGRGDQRARLSGDGHVRQAGAAPGRRAAAPGAAVEIRLQIDQIDREIHLHRQASGELLGSAAGERVRLLGECQSGGAAPALEPSNRARVGQRRAPPNAKVERLWRIRRPSL